MESFETDIEDGLVLSASQLNAMRRQALDELKDKRSATKEHKAQPFEWSREKRTDAFGRNELWARFYKPEQICDADSLDKIILPARHIDEALVQRYGSKLVAELPALLFPKDEDELESKLCELKALGLKEIMGGNIYAIDMAKKLGFKLHGGFALNVLNSEAMDFYKKQGLESLCVSFEAQASKIEALGTNLKRGAVVYGKLPLMYFRSCPVRAFEGCAKCKGEGELIDRKNTKFEIECASKRYSVLLNSLPLDIADKLPDNIDYRLLWFTRENSREISRVIERHLSGVGMEGAHTGGLYFRKLL